MLQNRVGALTALLGLLDMHGIFCLGFSMQDCHEATIARLIVSDPERTSEIFLEKGICYTESGVLVAVLRHGPADLKKCLDALYVAEMNVNFLYPLLPRAHRAEFQRHQSPVPAGPQPVGTAVFPFFPAALFRSVFSKRLKGLPGFFALTGGENMVWYGPHGKSTRNQSSQGTRGQLQQ